MDICITLPKTIKWSDYEKELKKVKDYSQSINFKVPFLPIKTNQGDKCFLCYNNQIIGYQRIVGLMDDKKFKCSITGKAWEGKFIVRSGPFVKLNNPIPCKGFQGFKYVTINTN